MVVGSHQCTHCVIKTTFRVDVEHRLLRACLAAYATPGSIIYREQTKSAKRILLVPREVLMPLILLFCVVGTFAINNSMFEIGIMLVAGILAYILEANKFPIAPAILGVVLGGMLEENFITSMIKSNGDLGAFLARPIALGLAVVCLLVWTWPLVAKLLFKSGKTQTA